MELTSTVDRAAGRAEKQSFGLVALAIGAFGIGVTEFAPMGLLPTIAEDLGASIPQAGLLISGYALGVMVGAPLMILATGRAPRRALLIGLAAIFTSETCWRPFPAATACCWRRGC